MTYKLNINPSGNISISLIIKQGLLTIINGKATAKHIVSFVFRKKTNKSKYLDNSFYFCTPYHRENEMPL